MNWNIISSPKQTDQKERLKEILAILLKNRQIDNKTNAKTFLSPENPTDLSVKQVGIDEKMLKIAINRVKKAINNQENIVIFGDYDADGITATAVLWETLHHYKAKVVPFIPHREKHGYGLSIKALNDVFKDHQPSLIITVDNGIVAHEAADYVAQKNIDLIITDHHVASPILPTSLAIIHTTSLAGAGVSWIFSREIAKAIDPDNWGKIVEQSLDLATIGTVADQVPLKENNRSLVTFGLDAIRRSKRVGLKELFSQSKFDQKDLSTHHINFVIAPRINAMGRLAHGLDSLRLLCTSNKDKAQELALMLGDTNQTRQDLTFELLQKAKDLVGEVTHKIIVVDDPEFHEGVIGLVAGKLSETHARPSIVIGRGEVVSKASARSIAGINIINLIRKAQHLLINAGGHPMAAGFTIETKNIEAFKQAINTIADQEIDEKDLKPTLAVDCLLELPDISWSLYKLIQKLEPFGSENQKPLFAIENIQVIEKLPIGKEAKHLKLILPSSIDSQSSIDALWFGKGEKIEEIGKQVDIVFSIDENTWNSRSKLQLLIKDLKKTLEKEEVTETVGEK